MISSESVVGGAGGLASARFLRGFAVRGFRGSAGIGASSLSTFFLVRRAVVPSCIVSSLSATHQPFVNQSLHLYHPALLCASRTTSAAT